MNTSPQPITFLNNLINQDANNWDLVEEALHMLDQSGVIALPKSGAMDSAQQQVYYALIASSFVSNYKRSEALQQMCSTSRYHPYTSKSFYTFLWQQYGAQQLTTPDPILNNTSVVQMLVARATSTHRPDPERLLPALDVWGTDAFQKATCLNATGEGVDLLPYLMISAPRLDLGGASELEHILLKHKTDLTQLQWNGNPALLYWCTPLLWNTYIFQGGDPHATVNSKDTQLPLWEAILKQHINQPDHPMHTHLLRWSTGNAAEKARSLISASYFNRLQRTYYDGIPLNRLKEALTSVPNWYELRDEHNRTPMMLTVNGHKSIFKTFKHKKYIPHLIARDDQQRNILAYVLSQFNTNRAEAATFLMTVPSILKAAPDGSGLVQHVHSLNKKMAGVSCYARNQENIVEELHAWLGTKEHHANSAEILSTYHATPAAVNGMARLMKNNAQVYITNPQLRGALALCCAEALARLAEKYRITFDTWTPSTQLDQPEQVKQLRTNKLVENMIGILEALLENSAAPKLSTQQQTAWHESIGNNSVAVLGKDYTYNALMNRFSRNALNSELGQIGAHKKERKL